MTAEKVKVGSVRVANVRTVQAEEGEVLYYIGRGRTPDGMTSLQLGNPFKVGEGYKRGEAVVAYESKLRTDCKTRQGHYPQVIKLAEQLNAGVRIVLVCWCSPNSCHGDVLKRAVEGYAKQLRGDA